MRLARWLVFFLERRRRGRVRIVDVFFNTVRAGSLVRVVKQRRVLSSPIAGDVAFSKDSTQNVAACSKTTTVYYIPHEISSVMSVTLTK